MFCHQCGNQIPNDSVFCSKCGQPVPQDNAGIPGNRPSQPISNIGWQQQMQPLAGLSPGQTPSPSSPLWPPTVQAGQFALPSQDVPSTVRAEPTSYPGWSPVPPTQAAQPPSQPGFSPYSQPSGPQPPVFAQPWQQTVQTGPTGQPVQSGQPSQPSWPGMMQGAQSGPVSNPSYRDPASVYPNWANTPSAPPRLQPPAAPSLPPPPPGKFQQWLIRTFQPGLAGNIIFGIVMGGLVALIIGALASILLVELFQAIAPNFGYGAANIPHLSGQDIMENVIGLVPLHASFRDGMQFFFLMHGVSEHLTYTTGSTTYNYNYNPTLNGLLIVPALALTFGGYIAASTDLQNRAKSSLMRGVAIALPYAIMMLLLAQQVNGNAPLPPYNPSTDTQTIAIDSTSLFIFSLLWAVIFGTLGATLKLGRGRWRHMATNYLASLPQRQIVGMVLGGLSGIGIGVSLSLLTVLGMLAFSAFSIPIFTQNLLFYSQGYGNWQYMTGWAIVQGPLHAVNLFSYSFGAPVTISSPKDLFQCFYLSCFSPGSSDHLTLSLFNASPHLPPWTNAFVVLPIISLFLGGRVSAAFGRAKSVGQGALQGALIAIPFTVLMMLLSAFAMLSYQYTGPFGQSNTTESLTLTFGVNPFDLLLWALISGAVLGGLGGAYQTGTIKASIGGLLRGLAMPLKALGVPGLVLVDRLSRRPRSVPHTAAQRLIAGAVFAAFILLIASGAVAVCFIALNQSIAYTTNTRLRDIASVVMIALPGLLLVSAAAAALTEEKLPPLAQMVFLPPAPPMPPPAPPYQTGQFNQY